MTPTCSVLLLVFVAWRILAVFIKIIRLFWNYLHFERTPIQDIETGNSYNLNDALPLQTIAVQESESANNTAILDVNEEMSKLYVQSCKRVFAEEDVKTGIRYLHTLGGISQHRNHKNLSNAILHIFRMRDSGCIKSFGLPDDFSKETLIEILVTNGNHELDDVMHAVDRCVSEGFLPDPEECAEKIRAMKGIEELRKELQERNIELVHSSEVFARCQSAMVHELAELNLKMRDLQAKQREDKRTIEELTNQLRYYHDHQ